MEITPSAMQIVLGGQTAHRDGKSEDNNTTQFVSSKRPSNNIQFQNFADIVHHSLGLERQFNSAIMVTRSTLHDQTCSRPSS